MNDLLEGNFVFPARICKSYNFTNEKLVISLQQSLCRFLEKIKNAQLINNLTKKFSMRLRLRKKY